jgi:hypothetical protein
MKHKRSSQYLRQLTYKNMSPYFLTSKQNLWSTFSNAHITTTKIYNKSKARLTNFQIWHVQFTECQRENKF